MNSSDSSSSHGRRSMTDKEEKHRRSSIQAIMKDTKLTPHERRKSIQSLMDGRRRSSTAQPNGANGYGDRGSAMAAMGMAAAAAMAAADFEDSSSDDEGEDEMNDAVHLGSSTPDNSNGNNNNNGKREAKKRASFSFKRGSSNITGEKGGKRRNSLRDSFTSGFSKMGMKSNGGNGGLSQPDTATMMCLPAPKPNALSKKMEKSRPPCDHYERNCSIVSPCCGLVFGCRICHDDCPVLPPPFLLQGGNKCSPDPFGGMMIGGGTQQQHHPTIDECTSSVAAAAPASEFSSSAASPAAKKAPMLSYRSASLPPNFTEEESHHEIDRFLIKEVICRECFTRQSSKTNNCVNCSVQFGTYHCSTCNLWMSADEEPYHCLKCGFCRVGGQENFTHCDDCGMCIDALLFEDHNCKSGKYMSNCPVCQEDLFSSRMASHEMPCGHAIHWHCFRELTSHDTRCPVCKKTAETHDQMEQTWNAMAMGIALQPVPADMARMVDILCNDCEGKSVNQRWHFLGVQCQRCTSFNTSVERTVMVGQEAADFLGPPSDIAAQAQWASGGADQNVLAALMGGGAAAAGMPGDGEDEDMDMEALNQNVAAEVMGIMNRTNQPFANSMEEEEEEEDEEEDDDDDDEYEDVNPPRPPDEMDQS